MDALRHDLRFTLRLLVRSPGFTAAVLLSLALGIGANTAIFTLLDAVMWRMLPVKDPQSLLVVGRQWPDGFQPGFTYPIFRAMRDNNSMAELVGYTTAPINVSIDGPPEPSVQGQLVTGNYFSLLGVSPVLGRTIGPDDDRVANGHPVAMLSYGYWERRFGRDPDVVGKVIRASGQVFTIVGVSPLEFFGAEIGTAPDLFVPLMMQPTVMPAFENLLDNPIVNRSWVQVLARTKAGFTPDQAAAALDGIVQAQEPPPPAGLRTGAKEGPPPSRVALTPAHAVSALRRQFSRPLFVLLAVVGLVLLTACANTAGLLLARGAARRPEYAMRLALGAGRHRLVRQLLIESLTLAVLGGACGVALAYGATRLLVVAMSIGRTPLVLDLSPNLRILAFTAVISVVTGLLFGLLPAWRATKVDPAPALKNVRSSVTRSLRPGRILAIAQLALSLLLIVGAGLFVRTLQNLTGQDAGRLRESVLILRVEPRGSDQRGISGTTERLDRTYRELIRRTLDIPGVRQASMANTTPTAPISSGGAMITLPSGERQRIPMLMVYPNYFSTIGTPILSGRDFGPGDLGEHAPAVCIVNESFAKLLYPGEDPVGKPCYTGRRARLLSLQQPNPNEPFQIVGVVKDSRYSNPRGEVPPVMYLTFLQTSTGRGQMQLHVRVAGNSAVVLQRIREEVAAVDPSMPMFDVHTLAEEMNAALVQQRLIAMLSTVFGGLALLLACVGLYGLLAFSLVQRTGEIGIRMALGARRADVVWLVVKEALMLVLVGVLVGVPAALLVARLASSQISGLLFGMKATDPATLGVACVILASVAVLAAYLPARRASRVDPMVALRAE